MRVCWSQDVFFSSKDVPKQVGHPVPALRGQDSKTGVPKRMMCSARMKMRGSSQSENLSKSFGRLIQTYSDTRKTSFKFNALFASPAHVVGLSFTKRSRRRMIGHGYTLLGSMPAGVAEVKEGDGEHDVDEVYARVCIVTDFAPGRRCSTDVLDECERRALRNAEPSSFVPFETAQRGRERWVRGCGETGKCTQIFSEDSIVLLRHS